MVINNDKIQQQLFLSLGEVTYRLFSLSFHRRGHRDSVSLSSAYHSIGEVISRVFHAHYMIEIITGEVLYWGDNAADEVSFNEARVQTKAPTRKKNLRKEFGLG